MKDFEIIDVHTHLSRNIEEEAEYYPTPGRRLHDRWGTPEKAQEYMNNAGISKMAFMLLTPRQYRAPLNEKAKLGELHEGQREKARERIRGQVAPLLHKWNEWGCSIGKQFPNLYPFICVSDDLGDAQDIAQEVVLRASQGARGVKLHPGIYSFFPNDEKLWPMYAKCQELGLPVLADSGPWGVSHVLTAYSSPIQAEPMHQARIDYGEPKNFVRVLENFPRLTLVLAHLGSAWWDERIELAQKYSNVYFDTSQGFSAPDRIPHNPHRGLAEEDVVRVMRKIGVNRVMFGTDGPALEPRPQLEQLLRLPLSDEEKQMILAENAKSILHLG